MRNCLTIDVEDWFHVCGAGGALAMDNWEALPSRVVDNTRSLLDLLDSCGVRSTFFVLGWVAVRHPSLVADIVRGGHEVGSHGHLHRRIYEMTQDEFQQDLDASRTALSAAGQREIRGYRAPEWSINRKSLWALDVLAAGGFAFDSSMAPMRIVGDPAYPIGPHKRTTARGDLVEFPPMVHRRFGQNMPLVGWGLRMSTPDRVIRAIEQRNSLGIPVALSVHPWEIDPDPPRVRLSPGRHFAHYFRLDGFRERLARILRGASFAPMGEVLGLSGPAAA